MDTIDLTPISFVKVSAEKFLRIAKREKKNIKSVSIIPPDLGELSDDDFGSLLVEYNTPKYRVRSK
jgi:hypothetical protein